VLSLFKVVKTVDVSEKCNIETLVYDVLNRTLHGRSASIFVKKILFYIFSASVQQNSLTLLVGCFF